MILNNVQVEYEKRYIKDKHRAYILTQQSMILKNHRELQKMVLQVSEVLPHVPREVIFRDLGKYLSSLVVSVH